MGGAAHSKKPHMFDIMKYKGMTVDVPQLKKVDGDQSIKVVDWQQCVTHCIRVSKVLNQAFYWTFWLWRRVDLTEN